MAFQELEPSTVFNRFHGPKKVLSESDLDRVVDVDHRRVVSLLATIDVGGEEVVIGGAQYVALAQPPDHAEIAFTIEEDFQGNGLGTILLRDLARIARQQGFTALEAYVLHTNHAMLRVFQGSGLPIVSRLRGDSIQIELDLCKPLS
jgi:RimJ/RimL family protein N-acetyltransferase